MSAKIKAPRVQIEVGDRKRFAIGVVLHPLPVSGQIEADGRQNEQSDATKILELTDGYVTFWVAGVNVLRIDPSGSVPDPLRYYSNVTLSMFLEWVYFDRAYDLTEGVSRSFSEIVEGEGTPDLRFRRMGDRVAVEWDFRNRTRNGSPFHKPVGAETIDFPSFLVCLAALVDDLTAAIENRARLYGAGRDWRKWLDGYAQEREEFTRFVDSALGAERTENISSVSSSL
jgi:hypothetical protein